jgi:hypothetical protein
MRKDGGALIAEEVSETLTTCGARSVLTTPVTIRGPFGASHIIRHAAPDRVVSFDPL